MNSLSRVFQNVHVHLVDMSSPRKVWEFANGFSQKHNLHALVNGFILDISTYHNKLKQSSALQNHCTAHGYCYYNVMTIMKWCDN